MSVKMNLRIIIKNHAADLEIEFLEKSISKPNGYATAMPTAWELIDSEWVPDILKQLSTYIWSQNMKILGLQIWNIVESERISDKADSVGSLD